mgnify:CR=1 FL=1
MITLSEQSRRMQEMDENVRHDGNGSVHVRRPGNSGSERETSACKICLEHGDGENTPLFCEQLYDLAMISHKPLDPDSMTKFVNRSNQIMMLLAK